MDILIKILVCLLAGVGAGFGTGFAGMSASAVITPVLIVLLDIDPYTAVGIALASDVLASAVSTLTYRKNKNTSIRKAYPLFVSVIVFTIVGSFVGTYLPDNVLGSYSMLLAVFLGLKFLIWPVTADKNRMHTFDKKYFMLMSIASGAVGGFVCGFVGGGGGLTLLFVLTAFTGAVSHFTMARTKLDYFVLSLCVVFTLVSAVLAAKIANKQDHKKLNRIVGIVLLVIGLGLIALEIIKYCSL